MDRGIDLGPWITAYQSIFYFWVQLMPFIGRSVVQRRQR